MSKTLTGSEAIEYKRAHIDAVLNKYTDPTEEARENISIDEAESVAAEDPELIWIEAE